MALDRLAATAYPLKLAMGAAFDKPKPSNARVAASARAPKR
jgi:hypothetical protein